MTGEPRPAVSWYLEKHEIKSDSDITLTYEGRIFLKKNFFLLVYCVIFRRSVPAVHCGMLSGR